MKGKKILALVSLFAGVALVGTTFATWAVTDSADPFGVKVSPGTIASDQINYVTLSYGERTYADVSGLAIGTTRLAATVNVKADTSNSQGYTGKFNVTLIDQTTGKESTDKFLMDYLTVKVYDTAITADSNGVVAASALQGKTPIGTFSKTNLSGDISVAVTDNVAKPLYVTVELASTVDASTLQIITSDVVFIQMNWNSNGTDEVSASKVYLQYSTAGKKAYCYAWTAAKVNDQYPGVEMKDEGDGLYSIDLSLEYEDLLFVVKESKTAETELYKSGDLEITSTIRTQTPCYKTSSSSWTAKSDSSLAAGYYLVGSINNWTPLAANKLTQDSVTSTLYYIENVQLSAGDKIKVRDRDGDNWYGSSGTWDGCGFTIDDDNNVIISESGVYTVNCNTIDGQQHYIYLTK